MRAPSNKRVSFHNSRHNHEPEEAEVIDYEHEVNCINQIYGMKVNCLIGRGTYSRVYKVRYGRTQYALKFMGAESYKFNGLTIKREIESLNALSRHENVITCIKTFTKTPIMILMELLPYDLYKLMKQHPLTPRFIHGACLQMMRALSHAHSKNIIHRDIKPSNILLHRDGRLVISDWGMSRQMDGSSHTPQQCSIWYRSIEILMEGKPTLKSDIWSVGCILGEMLRNNPLFMNNSELGMIRLIIRFLGSITPSNAGELIHSEGYEHVTLMSGRSPKSFCEEFPKASALCIECLRGLLTFDPQSRMSADDALSHPWLFSIADLRGDALTAYINDDTPLPPDTKMREMETLESSRFAPSTYPTPPAPPPTPSPAPPPTLPPTCNQSVTLPVSAPLHTRVKSPRGSKRNPMTMSLVEVS